MYFISITRLRLRSLRYLFPFLRYAIPSAREAAIAPGNYATQTRQQGLTVFWTVTVWDSEALMRQYMTSGTHRQAMPKLTQWCDEASTVHWLQAQAELPDWATMQARMRTGGRMYPVKHPSPHQAAGILHV